MFNYVVGAFGLSSTRTASQVFNVSRLAVGEMLGLTAPCRLKRDDGLTASLDFVLRCVGYDDCGGGASSA